MWHDYWNVDRNIELEDTSIYETCQPWQPNYTSTKSNRHSHHDADHEIAILNIQGLLLGQPIIHHRIHPQ